MQEGRADFKRVAFGSLLRTGCHNSGSEVDGAAAAVGPVGGDDRVLGTGLN